MTTTVIVDGNGHMARGLLMLDRPVFVAEVELGVLPSGEPAIPRLRILRNGHTAAESYWQWTSAEDETPCRSRYVYPGEKGAVLMLFQPGVVEFRVQARDGAATLVPLQDEVPPGWTFEVTEDGGKTWQRLDKGLPIRLRTI